MTPYQALSVEVKRLKAVASSSLLLVGSLQ